MQLGLSSAAARDADIDELVEACVRCGLGTLELRAGDAHGLRADSGDVAIRAVQERASSAQVAISAYWMTGIEADLDLAQLGLHLRAPIISALDEPLASRVDRTRRISVLGTHALLGVRGPSSAWLQTVVTTGLDFAWEIDPAISDPAADVRTVLDAAGTQLRYIRFVGGGPEAAMQQGRGVGALMGRLALARYTGPLVLSPSSARYRLAWAAWLGRRGGWGCGSATEARDRRQPAAGVPATGVPPTGVPAHRLDVLTVDSTTGGVR